MSDAPQKVEDFEYPSEEIQQCPYPFFEALRRECPVYSVPGRKAVQLSRYEDVHAAIGDWKRISSDRSWLVDELHPDVAAVLAEAWDARDVLLGEDPPSQTQHRRLVAPAFAPKRIALLRDEVAKMADDLVDQFAAEGEVDWVARFANLLPARVMTGLFGVPFSDHEMLGRYTEDYLDWTAKMLNPLSLERELECARSIVSFQHYVHDRLEQMKDDPGENLFGDLVQAESVSLGVKIDIAKTMLIAGVETTRGLLGSSLKLLLEHPDQLARVKADPELIPNVVEEALRIESPAQRPSRWIPNGAEVPAGELPGGHYMNLLLGSANRDERVFADPDRFDIDRENLDKHLAFGRGVHFCVGSPLARMEGVVSLEVALERLTNLRLGSEPASYRANPLTRALESLQITWDA